MAEKKVPLSQKNTGQGQNKKKARLDKDPAAKRKRIIKLTALFVGLFVLLCAGIGLAVIVSFASGAPPIDPALLDTLQTSYIYDHRDEQVAALHGEQNRILVSLDEIPEMVQKAFIAIEDERFEKHFGFDIIAFTRALAVNIRERGFSQGASTITQQLVQNVYLEPSRRVNNWETAVLEIRRKVQEIWLAIQFERLFSKEEILEFYLNRIYFGNGAYGVEAASRMYFDKSVGELDVHEAAMLAGLVRAPEYYNPFYYEDKAVERMKLVLGNMRRLGFINEAEYREALEAEFDFGPPPSYAHQWPHPYFIDYVVHVELKDLLKEKLGYETDLEAYNAIYTGGLHVYTTLNTAYQTHLEEVMNRPELYPETVYINMDAAREAINNLPPGTRELPRSVREALIDEKNGIPQPQAAIVLADPKTGAIWALGGGRGYSERNKVRRYESKRQPGSAIKPIIAYAPAFEEGVLRGAGSTIDDSPLIGPGGWYPENFDRSFRGLVTARQALAWSYNIPAVRAYQAVGLQRGAEYAQRMGLTTVGNPHNAVPSWALGSLEVTALDMAVAYGTLANNGVRIDQYTVRRIEDRNGNVIFEREINPQQVLSPQAAFIVTDILRDVVTATTARQLQPGRPMAAKTGTTDDARDIYLGVYAPNVVATFWMGYDEPLLGRIVHGWNHSSRMMREVFSEVFKTLPVENFSPAPPGVTRVEVCTKSGLLPSELCREAGTVRADYFMAKHAPRLTCDMHVALDICTKSGQLAGEFCPEEHLETRIFLDRPEFITTDHRWDRGAGRKPADAELMPPEETCALHTEFVAEITNFAAELRNKDVRLTWEYSGPRLEKFQLYRQAEGENEARLLDTIDGRGRRYEYTDKNVETGRTYTYTLFAITQQGTRSDPARVSIRVPGEAPGRPELTGEVKGSGIALSWKPADDLAARFEIYRRIQNQGSFNLIATVDGSINVYTDDNLSSGTTYQYQVVAVNRDGVKSQPSNTVEIKKEANNSGGAGQGNGPGGGLWAFLQRLWRPVLAAFSGNPA